MDRQSPASRPAPAARFPPSRPWTLPGITVNPLASTGNYNFQSFFPDHLNDYICSHLATTRPAVPQGVNYADPYYGGRGPQLITYNFSIQHMLNKKAVLTVSYSGSETHFLGGGSGRGYANNSILPGLYYLRWRQLPERRILHRRLPVTAESLARLPTPTTPEPAQP